VICFVSCQETQLGFQYIINAKCWKLQKAVKRKLPFSSREPIQVGCGAGAASAAVQAAVAPSGSLIPLNSKRAKVVPDLIPSQMVRIKPHLLEFLFLSVFFHPDL
jgi:hypothetical protein